MSINKIIKKLRTERKMTQNELAEMMNCNRQKIADWERGKSTPSADDLVLLSKTFNVSADYLLGISDVPTTDKDLQFICDYTGLDEYTVDSLKFNINKNIMLPSRAKRLPNLFDFLAYCENKYFKFYNDIFNEFLQSNCLLDIVTNCCAEKVLEYSLNELINFKNEGKDIKEISNYKKEKISMFYKITKDYFKQHDLNIFNTQKSVVNFLNSATNLNTVDEDEIEDIILYVSLALHRDNDTTDADNEFTDCESKIFGYDFTDLDSVSDCMIDKNYSIEDFIEISEELDFFKSKSEMQEYVVNLRKIMQEKGVDR